MTTLQIANLILYNFYFMQICHIFTPKALKLEKTKTRTYIHCNSCSFICMCVCPVNSKCQADILKEYESCDGTGFYGSLLAEVWLLHILFIFWEIYSCCDFVFLRKLNSIWFYSILTNWIYREFILVLRIRPHFRSSKF